MLSFIELNLDIATLQPYIIEYGTKIIGALLVLIIGWVVIGFIIRVVSSLLNKRNVDATLKPVMLSTISTLLKILVIIAAISTLGVATSSFVAILGAASLAIGLAMQGGIANLAGGILLLFFRPIRVGDYIKAQGEEGFVKEIQLFTTTLETPDHITVYIPNGPLANGNITNVSRLGTLRLHLPVGIAYDANIQAARTAIMQVLNSHPKVLNQPAPSVAVTNLGDSSVDLDMRPYVKAADVPAATVEILEQAKIALDKAGIEIPFPQQVVHHLNN